MDQQALIRAVTEEVLRQLAGRAPRLPSPPGGRGVGGEGDPPPERPPSHIIPVGVSARHCHLAPEHVAALFGPGQELIPRNWLYQPGQFAAEQAVTLIGPRGVLERVRVLGPTRPHTQVEVSLTDAIRVGVRPAVSDGSDPERGAPIVLVGPAGAVSLAHGLILAWRHIHLGTQDADYWRVKHQDRVRVELPGERGLILNNVIVRVSPDFIPQMHIDTDEANAAGITCALEVEIQR